MIEAIKHVRIYIVLNAVDKKVIYSVKYVLYAASGYTYVPKVRFSVVTMAYRNTAIIIAGVTIDQQMRQ